jgi:hypothetical protein
MASITLTELILRTRQRCDQENGGGFISDAEITHFLNDEISDLHAKCINVDDGALFATAAPTLTQIGDNAYQLPSDFLRLVDVNIWTGSIWTPSIPADVQNYYQLLSRTYQGKYDTEYFLRLNLSQDRYEIFLFPAQSPTEIGVRYIQAIPELSVGSDTLNWPSNWHAVAVLGAAAKCLIKEESDPTALWEEKAQATKRVLKDVRSQKVAEVKTLRQVSARNEQRGSRSRRRLPLI